MKGRMGVLHPLRVGVRGEDRVGWVDLGVYASLLYMEGGSRGLLLVLVFYLVCQMVLVGILALHLCIVLGEYQF